MPVANEETTGKAKKVNNRRKKEQLVQDYLYYICTVLCNLYSLYLIPVLITLLLICLAV